MRTSILLLVASMALGLLPVACSPADQPTSAEAPARRLPFLGVPPLDGAATDTLPAPIPAFRLTDQDSQRVTKATFAGHIYVANFFFATCPSICPPMQRQLLRVYEDFADEPRVLLLSHTIDPAHDSVAVLRDYAQRLGVATAARWHFVTAPRDTIFGLARAYLATAQADAKAAGGLVHSGSLTLVDAQGRTRGLYDGLNPKEVDRLLRDIPVLLRETGPGSR
ncbi:MAG: SCO family protein [Hymenobacter sp.]|nr:SCO family protein [Hymenobacter sp.]